MKRINLTEDQIKKLLIEGEVKLDSGITITALVKPMFVLKEIYPTLMQLINQRKND